MSETNIVTGCDGDDCLMCSGEACNLCGAGCWSNRKDCEHDVIERHEEPETSMTAASPTLAQQETLERCPLGHPEEKGLHVNSSSGIRKWHITCFDCGLYLEGILDETIRSLARRWNTRCAGSDIVAALTTARREAREAAFRELVQIVRDAHAQYKNQSSLREAILDGIEADANSEEGGGDGR